MGKNKEKYSSDTIVRKPNKFLYRLFSIGFDAFLSFNFKISLENKIGKLDKPSIVLVTHGCFFDFMISLKYLKRYYPHVVAARLYLYHKTLGSLLKKGGVIPKSMFTADLENAKNCVRVLKNNEMLLMMPEARLSTVGRYEGVQNVTAKFLHKAGVDLYLLKINGNYLAMPKWGNGARRGSKIECTLSRFYDKDELKNVDYDTFKAQLDEAMYYDDYEWLKSHPEIKYRSKKLAEGLEGVLYKCPHCGSECTNETKGRKIRCSACGAEAELDSRYNFISGAFKDIRDWYDYQYNELINEIEANENYALTSKVELKHSSLDGKTMLRHSGEGICTLDRTGLTYAGTEDGKDVELHFDGNRVYRLLFGVNEDFELYVGKEIYYFVPEDKRICAKWYLCSTALKEYFKG